MVSTHYIGCRKVDRSSVKPRSSTLLLLMKIEAAQRSTPRRSKIEVKKIDLVRRHSPFPIVRDQVKRLGFRVRDWSEIEGSAGHCGHTSTVSELRSADDVLGLNILFVDMPPQPT